ncbi:helical membrane plugin domain-containing protein [Cytobacillus kochii]
MAKAITNIEKYIKNKDEEKQESIQQVLDAVSENSEALITFMDILKELHEFGVLDIVQGALKNREEIGVIAVSQVNQPGMHHIMKNGMNAIQFLAKLEPDKMNTILQGVEHGIERLADTQNNKSLGFFGMGKAMFDPNVSLALGSMVNFMRGMGEGMNETGKDHQ